MTNLFSEKIIKNAICEFLPNEVLFALGDKYKVECASLWINKQQKEIYQLKEENKKLKNQLESVREFLDKFVTKSNGLSMLFRATWRPSELQKRIKDLYKLQRDVEEYWECVE